MERNVDPNERLGYVNQMYDKGNQSRWMYLAQWMLNFHFFIGNQWVQWHNGERKWETLPDIEGEIRLVQNKILSATRMLIGRMLKSDNKQHVIHATNDEESMDAAKAATRFLEYIWRKTHADGINQEVYTWAAITGIGITKIYYDPDSGPKRKSTNKPDGEIKVDIVSPFEFIVPPNARYFDKLPWAIHARIETKEWVWENYGVEVEANGDLNNWAIYQATVQNITTEGAFFGNTTQFENDSVLVKEMWIRPCKQFPNGRVIIVGGKTILHDDDIPFDKNYWPFNHMKFFDVPFRLWPMGIVEPMIDTQKSINRMASDILMNIKYMGKPVILAPQGSVDPDEMVAEPGAVWQYNQQMGKPEFAMPHSVPVEVFNEKSLLEQHIFDIAGIHMAGAGLGGIRAAAAVMLLEQQDETEFQAVNNNVMEYLRRDAEIKLFLAQKGFKQERMVKVLGEEGQWEVVPFRASDLTGDEEVEILAKQEFANDKMTRFNQVTQLAQLRDENNQPYIDRQTVLRLLDIADMGSAMTDFDLDYNRAKWENEQIDKGKEVSVNSFDDHSVHIKVHNQERKRIDFEKLPQHVQDLYAHHVLMHQQMMQGESGQQQSAKGDNASNPGMPQGMPPGMPPQGPPPNMPPMQPPQGPPVPFGRPSFNPASGLQAGVDATHNMLGKVGL